MQRRQRMGDSSGGQRYQVIPRKDWESQVESDQLEPDLPLSFKHVLIRDIPGTKVCTNFLDCMESIKTLEKADIESGLSHIRYNFVVGADLKVYCGRGWLCKPSVPEEFLDIADSTLHIGLIGDFSSQSPPFISTYIVLKIISYGLNKGYIVPTFKLIQLKKTSKTI